jgi:PAS domain S-box-containing protein
MSKDSFGPVKRHHWLVVAGLTVTAAAIFAADVAVAHGYTVWVLYLPLCVTVAWFDRPREAVAASATATILIAAGHFLSPDAGPGLPAVVSRFLEALTIWLAIAVILSRRQAARTTELAFQAARDANDRLSGIIINIAEDAIICVDAAQRITLFNHGAERIFGYTTAEAIGRSLTMLLPTRAASAHQKFVDDFGASPVQSRRMAERGTVAGIRKDGSEFPAEISISKLSTPSGVVYTAILRDTTERLKSDELLREREQRLRVALSAGRMGTFLFDEATGMVQADETAQRHLGLPPQYSLTQFFERVHPDDHEAIRASLAKGREKGGSFSYEFRTVDPDGRIRWIAVHGIAEHDANGKPTRRIGVNYDITEQKALQEALEARVAERTADLREEIQHREAIQADLLRSQKLQAVGELAGGMAHDFNNLLTVITGNLELLGLRQLDDKSSDLIRRAEEAAKMGARLSGRLLAIGRRQRLQPVELELNGVTRSMTDVLRRTLGDQIEIHMDLAPDLWPALADLSEVENAILNIAINARDAMPQGGRLVIGTANRSLGPDDVVGEVGLKPGDYVLLSITDTGVGIPPHLMGRVFEPFFTTKEAGRGTGLGLSTIYGFAKQSGGHLTIYSEVGKGTAVRLYLPRAASIGAAEARADAAVESAVEGETILVVEDNAEVREVTVKRLDMLGYRVLKAENGPAAIKLLETTEKIDLMFSDVMMPGGMSGFDLARWVRANRPTIKVLLTSGFTGEIAKDGEAAVDNVEVLRKPYAIAELARAVRETLSAT